MCQMAIIDRNGGTERKSLERRGFETFLHFLPRTFNFFVTVGTQFLFNFRNSPIETRVQLAFRMRGQGCGRTLERAGFNLMCKIRKFPRQG